ncbi:hypothetical protein MOUN0_L07866 [Monosporozyma unispora]|nr:hypothetical protein C6P44_004843 [Kazachstania unispora]
MSDQNPNDVSTPEVASVPPPNHNLALPIYSGHPLRYVYQLSTTPYPALLQGSMLLMAPYLSPQLPIQMVASNSTLAQRAGTAKNNGWFSPKVQDSMGPFARTKRVQNVGLSGRSALLFGLVSLAGSWMIFDDDLESGSGFTAAWSGLYLLLNGKASIKWLQYGKMWPLLVSGVALGNTAMYGRRFLTGGFD